MKRLAQVVVSTVAAAVREYSTIWLVACVGLALSLLGFGMLRRQLEVHKSVEFEWVGHPEDRCRPSTTAEYHGRVPRWLHEQAKIAS